MSTHLHEAPKVSWARQIAATPLSRARAWILVSLLGLTIASWWYLLDARASMHHEHMLAPTMGLGVALWLAVWIVMMVATMFPSVSPMVLMFARVSANRRGNGRTWAPLSLFVAGYLLLWSGMGVLAYGAAVLVERMATSFHWVDANAARLGGLVILVAGAFQFTELKERCLTECRSPLPFLVDHWRDGRLGAVRMGVRHGLSCLGCCWALMAVLFPVGMMNIAALAAVTAMIYAEKVLPGWKVLGRVAGYVLIALGLAVLLKPSILPSPSHPPMHHHTMS